jgi:hypothetical protein
MASYERLLVPGSTDLPDCHCGELIHIEGGENYQTEPMRRSEFTDAVSAITRCD